VKVEEGSDIGHESPLFINFSWSKIFYVWLHLVLYSEHIHSHDVV
jgi:hypothetical protein